LWCRAGERRMGGGAGGHPIAFDAQDAGGQDLGLERSDDLHDPLLSLAPAGLSISRLRLYREIRRSWLVAGAGLTSRWSRCPSTFDFLACSTGEPSAPPAAQGDRYILICATTAVVANLVKKKWWSGTFKARRSAPSGRWYREVLCPRRRPP
jgi:hypothetical protein